jgi:hypothetical protein
MAMLYHVLSLILITSFATPQITERDIADVITAYRQTSVETFRQRMPPPPSNRVRDFVYQYLPTEFSNQVNDEEVAARVRLVLVLLFRAQTLS